MTADPERFDRVTQHADYAATADRRIELPYSSVLAVAGPGLVTMFGVLFLLVAIGMIVAIGPPLLFSIIFIGMAIAFIVGSAGLTRRGFQFHAMPIVPTVALVIKDRTDVSGQEHTSTTYYTTLQTRDGQRMEYLTPGKLAGILSVDDIGVAFIKGHMLVDFQRFDV